MSISSAQKDHLRKNIMHINWIRMRTNMNIVQDWQGGLKQLCRVEWWNIVVVLNTQVWTFMTIHLQLILCNSTGSQYLLLLERTFPSLFNARDAFYNALVLSLLVPSVCWYSWFWYLQRPGPGLSKAQKPKKENSTDISPYFLSQWTHLISKLRVTLKTTT